MAAFCVQGRLVEEAQIERLRAWIQEHPDWSRKRLARALCEQWHWRDARGRLKDFAARSFLLKLEARGWIRLPALRLEKRRARKPPAVPEGWREPPPREATLREIRPVRLERIVAGTPAAARWAFWLDRYHYLGLRVVGENVGYLAYDGQDREVACLLFGAAAWRCAPRDSWLQWTSQERRARLGRLANNTRLLILPWVRVPHLASHLLGMTARRIQSDWQEKYGHGLDWLESFVDTERYSGTCYQAANWRRVGLTRGRSRQDRDHRLRVSPKAVYLCPLHR